MLWKLFCDPTHDIVEILVVVDGDLQKAGAIGMRLYRWADYFARQHHRQGKLMRRPRQNNNGGNHEVYE